MCLPARCSCKSECSCRHVEHGELTPFNSDDGAPEANGNREVLPHVYNAVEETELSVPVGNDAMLLLQRLRGRRRSCDADPAAGGSAGGFSSRDLP